MSKGERKGEGPREGKGERTSDGAPEGKRAEARADDKKPERKTEAPEQKKAETGVPGKRLFFDPTLHAIDALDVETIALGLCSDVRPLAGAAGYLDWRVCGRLSAYVRKGTITGAAGEKVLLPCGASLTPSRILVFGWGPKASLLDNATARFAWMVEVLQRAGAQRIAVALPEPAGILVGLVEEHLRRPLGERLAVVFSPDPLMADAKDTRPIPAAPPAGAPPAAP